MSDIKKRLDEWNEAISEGEAIASDMRKRVVRSRDGFMRRLELRMLRFLEKWIKRGKAWRDEDIFD